MVVTGAAPEAVPVGLLRRYLRAQQWDRMHRPEDDGKTFCCCERNQHASWSC
jgi:hypothetical protein